MLMYLSVGSEASGVVPKISVVVKNADYFSDLGVADFAADSSDLPDDSSAKIVVLVFAL